MAALVSQYYSDPRADLYPRVRWELVFVRSAARIPGRYASGMGNVLVARTRMGLGRWARACFAEQARLATPSPSGRGARRESAKRKWKSETPRQELGGSRTNSLFC